MTAIVMEAKARESFGKGPNRRLRAEGKVPAVLYGNNEEPVALTVDPKEVTKIIRSHGGVNTIFELSIQGTKGKQNVMIKEYQIEPVEHLLLHADLIRVAMDKGMMLSVAVELTGTAVGVKTGGGTLDFVTRAVEVSCLPKDIPETIVVDVTDLDIGSYLRASELQMPTGVTLISEGNVVIAHVLAPKVEEEPEAEEGELVAAEGAEGAEGAEAPKEEASEEDEGKGKGKGKGKE